MKKWLSLLMAALIVLTTLGGIALADDKTVITINTSASVGSEEAWTAVANAYMAKHPEVNVVVDLKPSENYSQWVQNMFATDRRYRQHQRGGRHLLRQVHQLARVRLQRQPVLRRHLGRSVQLLRAGSGPRPQRNDRAEP